MQQKRNLKSFFNQVFLDIKPKEDNKNISQEVTASLATVEKVNPILDEAFSIMAAFTESIPQESKQAIFKNALSRQGSDHINQILVEATLKKAQLIKDIKQQSEKSDEELTILNTEIDRLWNLRDEIQEEAKQKQWALSQESEVVDQLISLLVPAASPIVTEPASSVSPTEKREEPELVVIGLATAPQASYEAPDPHLPERRNPRQLSSLLTAIH